MLEQPIKQKRIKWIDIARGIAIIAVIVGHSLGKYFPGKFANFIFAFHMPIFFILSGYLYHYQSKRKLLKKTFLNLLVPYIATVTIELGLLIVYRVSKLSIIAPSQTTSIKLFLISIIYAAGGKVYLPFINKWLLPVGALWFLVAMFIATQLFNLIMSLSFRKYDFFFKAFIIFVLATIGVESAKYIFLPFSIQPALLSLVFLWLGYVTKKYQLISKFTLIPTIVCFILWVIDAQFNFFVFENVNSTYMLLGIIMGYLSSMVVIKCSILVDKLANKQQNLKQIRWIKQVLVFWGANSLLILCFHLIDLNSVQIWPRIVFNSKLNYNVVLIMGIIYRIVFATFFAFIMPRVPVLRNLYMNRQFPIRNIFRYRKRG